MPVTLVRQYDPGWRSWFLAITEYLGPELRDSCTVIEHVGSTSVPGMVAKPIIDLDLVILRSQFGKVRSLLETKGYFWEGDLGIPDREAFKIPDETLRQGLPPHHLYVCPSDSTQLKRHLAFRSFLLDNPEYVTRLSNLKWALCERFDNDREAYMAGKDALCREIIERGLQI